MRRVRQTAPGTGEAAVEPASGQRCADERGRDDGVKLPVDEQSATGGRGHKPRPVTMAPTGGTGTSDDGGQTQPEWMTRLAQRRTRES